MTEEPLPEELPTWLERLQQKLNQVVLRKKSRGWKAKKGQYMRMNEKTPSERPSTDGTWE